MTQTGIDGPDPLRHRLAALEKRGCDGFDPPRFRYIAALARRALEKRGGVRHRIEQLAQRALGELQEAFERERAKAADLLAATASEFPEDMDRIRRLFSLGDFKGIRQRLERRRRREDPGPLAALTNRIEGRDPAAAQGEAAPLSFDALLMRQEAEALGSAAAPDCPGPGDPFQSRDVAALKGLCLFKKTWAALASDRLVASAIRDCPENAGPLNSQMLVTRSLSIMRKLSPGYLSRFISYIDTLLWLERAQRAPRSRTAAKRDRRRTD
jgi:Protein of unknown function (DUF2894)